MPVSCSLLFQHMLCHANTASSSYSLDQSSDVSGSPFTATSFKDCLRQCDDNWSCNYMSFDASKFSQNCAMFSRGGVSVDILTANPSVDSAKALVGQAGGQTVEFSPSDSTVCPAYDSSSGVCVRPPGGGKLRPLHYSSYSYTSACKTNYIPRASATISTLTVNTFEQCLDACDVSIPLLHRLHTETCIPLFPPFIGENDLANTGLRKTTTAAT